MSTRDWQRALSYLTVEARKGVIGAVCMGTAYAVQADLAKAESYGGLLSRHGLLGKDEMPESADLGVLFRELMDWVEANLEGEQLIDLPGSIAATTYSDFRIEGDFAYARQSGPQGDSTARFKKVDGFWYVGTG